MKKDKRLVSKVSSGAFSFRAEEVSVENVFSGYPSFVAPYSEDVDPEQDALAELNHALEILKFSDENPPQIETIHGRSIFFCVCFESREQKNTFLQECDLFRLGDKYLSGEDFAEAFGIDLTTGARNVAAAKKGMAFGKSSLALSNSLNFGKTSLQFTGKKKKSEVSEKLKNIRADEKQLAKYMEWCADPEYWICLCFRTESEKANMLKALGLELEFGGKYLWGHDVAKALGKELVPCPFKNKGLYSGRETKLEAMVGEDL